MAMKMFENMRRYESPLSKTKREDVEYIPLRKLSKKEKIMDFISKTFALWLYFGLTVFFGLLWYIFSWSFCGMMFFGLLALLVFVLITPGFAKLSNVFERKLGETTGSTLGCFGMLLGPVVAVCFFVSSIPYWDYESHYEQQYSPTVYYTPYGECYHSSPYCYHIEGHTIYECKEYNAEEKGLRPCSDCY